MSDLSVGRTSQQVPNDSQAEAPPKKPTKHLTPSANERRDARNARHAARLPGHLKKFSGKDDKVIASNENPTKNEPSNKKSSTAEETLGATKESTELA